MGSVCKRTKISIHFCSSAPRTEQGNGKVNASVDLALSVLPPMLHMWWKLSPVRSTQSNIIHPGLLYLIQGCVNTCFFSSIFYVTDLIQQTDVYQVFFFFCLSDIGLKDRYIQCVCIL